MAMVSQPFQKGHRSEFSCVTQFRQRFTSSLGDPFLGLLADSNGIVLNRQTDALLFVS